MKRTMNDVGFDWINKMEEEITDMREEQKRRKYRIIAYSAVACGVIGFVLITLATNKN